MDKKAYVADGPGHYLQVIDVSVPSNPVIIGSVYTPDSPAAVTVVNQTAYVANRFAGLQKIDISDPKNPEITGSVNTPGNASDVIVIDKIAYIADGIEGLSIVPIPEEITQMRINGHTELKAILPSQEFKGNFKVRFFDNSTSDSIVIPYSQKGYSVLKGDINLDKMVDLKDSILSLEVMTGLNQFASKQADVNGDQEINYSESVYPLNIMTAPSGLNSLANGQE